LDRGKILDVGTPEDCSAAATGERAKIFADRTLLRNDE
jgi:hypothetical protein